MYLPLSKILTGDSYVICWYIAPKFCMLLVINRIAFEKKKSDFFSNFTFKDCKKAFFIQKQIFTKNKIFNLEEHVLLELRISVDFIISFSSFEVIVLHFGVKGKREVPRGVRNSKVRRQDKFRRDWSRH